MLHLSHPDSKDAAACRERLQHVELAQLVCVSTGSMHGSSSACVLGGLRPQHLVLLCLWQAPRRWHRNLSVVGVHLQTAVNMSLLEFEPVPLSAYTGGAAKSNGAEAPADAEAGEAAAADGDT